MKFSNAVEQAKQCPEAIPCVLKATGHRSPPPNAEAIVVCKIKVRRGIKQDRCNSDCPIEQQALAEKAAFLKAMMEYQSGKKANLTDSR